MSAVAPEPRGIVRAAAGPLRVERLIAGLVVGLPALLTLVAISWSGAHQAPLRDAGIAAVFYLISGLGITVGYHRLFTHRSFECPKPVRAAFAVAGAMALEGPVIRWVADHRRHHMFSDREGDPHSPVQGGVIQAHCGWFFRAEKSRVARYAKDLLGDPLVRSIDRLYPLWILLSLGAPALVGFVLGGTLQAALSALLWGGFVRIFLVHHVTWSINSICHVFGARPYSANDSSGNVAWLAVLSLGESWHNNHHAFPSSARHGIDRHQFDLSAWVIAGLQRLGLASNVKLAPAERDNRRVKLSAKSSTAA